MIERLRIFISAPFLFVGAFGVPGCTAIGAWIMGVYKDYKLMAMKERNNSDG